MTTPRRSSLTRLFAVLAVLAVLVTGCPSEPPNPDPGSGPATVDVDDLSGGNANGVATGAVGTESCAAIVDDGSPRAAAVTRLCTLGLSDDELSRFAVEECPDQGLNPRVRYAPEEGEGSLAFFMHMMVRFHPVDDLDDGPPGAVTYRPADDHQRTLADDRRVLVLDTGSHGEFASLVIAEILQIDSGDISRIDLNGQLPQVLAQPSADLEAPVVSVGLVNRAPLGGRGLLTTEADLVGALNSILENDEIDKDGLVINMSFGAYNCNEEPSALRAPIEALVAAGAHIVASAGNDESDDRVWPAGWADDPVLADGVTSVGSVVTGEHVRSCFSNYGDHVEAWVPGEEVVTDMGQWSGTSFAAPQVTALIAAGEAASGLHTTAPQDPPDMYDIALDVDGETVLRQTYCSEESGYGPEGAEY